MLFGVPVGSLGGVSVQRLWRPGDGGAVWNTEEVKYLKSQRRREEICREKKKGKKIDM